MLTFNLPLCLWQTLNVSGVLCRCWLNFSICLWQTLSHCELITDEGIRHIGSGACATEQLRILELDNCPLITDASLEHLTGCQNLERIELYDCQLITKAAIRRLRVRFVWIIKSSPKLHFSSSFQSFFYISSLWKLSWFLDSLFLLLISTHRKIAALKSLKRGLLF